MLLYSLIYIIDLILQDILNKYTMNIALKFAQRCRSVTEQAHMRNRQIVA